MTSPVLDAPTLADDTSARRPFTQTPRPPAATEPLTITISVRPLIQIVAVTVFLITLGLVAGLTCQTTRPLKAPPTTEARAPRPPALPTQTASAALPR